MQHRQQEWQEPPASISGSVWGKTQSPSVHEVMTAPWWHVSSSSSQAKGELTATQDDTGYKNVLRKPLFLRTVYTNALTVAVVKE